MQKSAILKMDEDIELDEFDTSKATITFNILKAAAVDAFLNNSELMSFLKSSPENNGMRVNIAKIMGGGHPGPESSRYLFAEEDRPQLVISRQLTRNTIRELAWVDLLATLNTFFAPCMDIKKSSSWRDLTQGRGEPGLHTKVLQDPNHPGYQYARDAQEFKQQNTSPAESNTNQMKI